MSSPRNTMVNGLDHGVGEPVVIAIGSNQASSFGSPAATVRKALQLLAQLSSAPMQVSSLWQTQPQQCTPDMADFINAVVVLSPKSDESPHGLLAKLQQIEVDFGRDKLAGINQPRPLDLDIICFGSLQIDDECLVLPHPRAHLRRFVLRPLKELLPNLLLPGQSSTISQLENALLGQAVSRYQQGVEQ